MSSTAAGARRPSRRRILAGVVAVASVPVICSCGLGSGPPPRQFTLTPVTNFPRGRPLVKWSLVVDEPTAARQIDTSRIALMNGPFRVEYYADVEWTDNAPAMVQLLLIQSFQNTGRLPVEFTKISGGEPIRTAPHTRAGRPRSAPDAGAVYRSPFTSSGRGSR